MSAFIITGDNESFGGIGGIVSHFRIVEYPVVRLSSGVHRGVGIPMEDLTIHIHRVAVILSMTRKMRIEHIAMVEIVSFRRRTTTGRLAQETRRRTINRRFADGINRIVPYIVA